MNFVKYLSGAECDTAESRKQKAESSRLGAQSIRHNV